MILKCIGIAILGIAVSSVMKNFLPSLVPFTVCGCGLAIIAICLENSNGLFGYYYELCNSRGYTEYFNVMVKGLGISFIANTGCDMCRDCGEGQLASYLEFAGKTEILVIAFPLIRNLVEISEEIMLR